MADLRRRSVLESTLVLALLGGFALFIAYGALRVFLLKQRFAGENAENQKNIEMKEKEIADLNEKIKKLKSGEGVELEARGRLNLQKPDEHVLIIGDTKNEKSKPIETQTENFFDRVKQWFGLKSN